MSEWNERPARVLLVELANDGTVGGSHQCLMNIARALDRRRFTPLACFLEENSVAERLRREGIETRVLEPKARSVPARGRSWIGRRATNVARYAWTTYAVEPRELRRILTDWRVDLLHQNNSVGLGAEWTLAASELGLPVVVHQRGYYFGRTGARVLTDRRIDRVVCISRSVESALRESTSISESRVRQLWDFLDTDRFTPLPDEERVRVRERLGVGAGELLLGMVGNLKPWKGQHVVVEALPSLPAALRGKVRCAFFGSIARRAEDVAYAERLTGRVRELGLEDRVSFPGFQDGMERVYPALDILIHASVTPEPFGMVLVEAMACGTPVVGTRGGGPDDIVEPGKSGLLVEPGKPAELARALEALLSDPERRREMGREARRTVLARFSSRAVMPRLEEIYDSLVHRAAGR